MAVELSVSKRNTKEKGDVTLAQVNQMLDDLNASMDKKGT
jgi:hypothetical protein